MKEKLFARDKHIKFVIGLQRANQFARSRLDNTSAKSVNANLDNEFISRATAKGSLDYATHLRRDGASGKLYARKKTNADRKNSDKLLETGR